MMNINEVLDRFVEVHDIPVYIDNDNNKWYGLNKIKFVTGVIMNDFEAIMTYKYVEDEPYITKTGLLKMIQEEGAGVFKEYINLLDQYKRLVKNMNMLEEIIRR